MNSWVQFVLRSAMDLGLVALLLDGLIISLLLSAVAGGVCFAWPRRAASTRHGLWGLVLAGALGVPLLSQVLPGWSTPLWTVRAQSTPGNELTLTLEFAPVRNVSSSPVVAAPDSVGAAAPDTPRSGEKAFAARFGAGPAAWAIGVWLIGVVLALSWPAVDLIRLAGMSRRARTPEDRDWLVLLRCLREELGISRNVILLQSDRQLMPVTWGSWRPVVLLPGEADSWPAERRRVVLLHELAHVKRWDCLTQMIGTFVCAVYWFNPLVWFAAWQMCLERERACDDLVLTSGCRASDYATHLVEVARGFQRIPHAAGIAMARSSHLGGRVEAIVDASRTRKGAPALALITTGVAVLGILATIGAQPAGSSSPEKRKPWYDAELRAFFAQKAAQSRRLAEGKTVSPLVWDYFDAGMKGDWKTATNLWVRMRQRAHQYEGVKDPDESLDVCWGPVLETDLAWEQFANWSEKYVRAYGHDIIKSIPAGSIYFGGTDPGRGVITARSKAHAQADPFFTLTQNALADATYLDYLRAMYGSVIYTPTSEDSQKCFQEYLADAQRRLQENKLKPGEDVQMKDGSVKVSGQVAVMSINALLVKVIFDRNTNHEFYVEESFPLDWMYPHLAPNGLIMKIQREPLASLPEQTLKQDREYWARYVSPMLGDWLGDDTSVTELTRFVEKVYLQHDLSGFKGDPQFVKDVWAQKAFSKLRSSLGGLYQWRANNTTTPKEREIMVREADFAFRQAYALCPVSPEAIFRYTSLLISVKRFDDAILVAETSRKLDPGNAQVKSLLDNLKNYKKQVR